MSLYAVLNNLEYNLDAERGKMFLPSVAVCWNDEGAGIQELMKLEKEDRAKFHRILSIRTAMWRDIELSESQALLWKELEEMAPRWPGLRRLKVSDEIISEQVNLENNVYEFIDSHRTIPMKSQPKQERIPLWATIIIATAVLITCLNIIFGWVK